MPQHLLGPKMSLMQSLQHRWQEEIELALQASRYLVGTKEGLRHLWRLQLFDHLSLKKLLHLLGCVHLSLHWLRSNAVETKRFSHEYLILQNQNSAIFHLFPKHTPFPQLPNLPHFDGLTLHNNHRQTAFVQGNARAAK